MSLFVEDFVMPAVQNGEDDRVPPVYRTRNLQQPKGDMMDEDDELFLGFGFEAGGFPYKYQNNYSRTLENRTFKAVRLENKYLRAVFLPQLGGRLWELHDKENDKPLLFVNPVYRLGNLAIRNAWFSGGVEFNCGIIGHHPHTCECINSAAGTLPDGTPYFRMYEFERIRCVTYQIDCFLPENSKFLFVRCKIMNENARVVPAYWWSNIAVPAYEGGRVIVPADTAFSQEGGKVHKKSVPLYKGRDITFPESTHDSFDYFWNIPHGERKYVTHVDKSGYGLLQCSTERLKGRKLFVWGQSAGSRRWQAFLSDGTKNGNYHEIQAGIGKTQYECVPMPPFTTWEWLEAYGALQINEGAAFGSWDGAKAAANGFVNEKLPAEYLQALLNETREASKTPAEKVITYGSGWAALENERRRFSGRAPLAKHLSFAPMGEQQKYWHNLLLEKRFAQCAEKSYMRQAEWTELLQQISQGTGKHDGEVLMHLGLIALSDNRIDEAEKYLEKALAEGQSPEALFGMGVIAQLRQNTALCADYACAAAYASNDLHYAKQAVERMYNAGQYERLLSFMEQFNELWNVGRSKMYAACALVRLGNLEKAEQLILENGGLELPDLREGETAITELWIELQSAKEKAGIKTGLGFDGKLPEFFDFRLHEEQKKEEKK